MCRGKYRQQARFQSVVIHSSHRHGAPLYQGRLTLGAHRAHTRPHRRRLGCRSTTNVNFELNFVENRWILSWFFPRLIFQYKFSEATRFFQNIFFLKKNIIRLTTTRQRKMLTRMCNCCRKNWRTIFLGMVCIKSFSWITSGDARIFFIITYHTDIGMFYDSA